LATARDGGPTSRPLLTVRAVRRRYRPGTLVLETEFDTDAGLVGLSDGMPVRTRAPDLIRIVERKRGAVPMRLELAIRLDGYGAATTGSGRSATRTPWALAGCPFLGQTERFLEQLRDPSSRAGSL
jgi:hypothetical protein